MTNLKMFLYSRALFDYNIHERKEITPSDLFLILFVLNNGEKFTLRINGGFSAIQGNVGACFEKGSLELYEHAHFDLLYIAKLAPLLDEVASKYSDDPYDERVSFQQLEEIIEMVGGIDWQATMDYAIKNFEKNNIYYE